MTPKTTDHDDSKPTRSDKDKESAGKVEVNELYMMN